MADILWPAGLPQAPQVARYSQVDQDRTVRTAMDVGPAKVRRRTTAAIETCEIELRLTRAQVAAFKAFFRDYVQAGAIPFEWKHHETGNIVDYRFIGPPTTSPLASRQDGTEHWTATFQLEVMPGTEVIEPPDPPPPAPPEADPEVYVLDAAAEIGHGAALDAALAGDTAMFFLEPDDATPSPEELQLVFVEEVPSDDSLLPSIVGDDAPNPTSQSTPLGSDVSIVHDLDGGV